MKWRSVTTLHDAICGCCRGPAVLAMAGEQFHHGNCQCCGLILAISHDVAEELVRLVVEEG